MQMTGNTILVTGGGGGIGRALAEAFLARGNAVIVAGRGRDALDAATAANPGMHAVRMDVDDPASIAAGAARVLRDHPGLDAVVHMAGIMRNEDLRDGSAATAEATVTTNLLGPIRLNAALLPALLRRPRATVVTVSSGLAFAPLAMTPAYSATKAAIHSWTQSLRYQLKDTAVQVIELVPPYVRTSLMGERQAGDPDAMPLGEFVAEAMGLLESRPDADEILVGRVMAQREAPASGAYETFFAQMNDRLAAARAGEA